MFLGESGGLRLDSERPDSLSAAVLELMARVGCAHALQFQQSALAGRMGGSPEDAGRDFGWSTMMKPSRGVGLCCQRL